MKNLTLEVFMKVVVYAKNDVLFKILSEDRRLVNYEFYYAKDFGILHDMFMQFSKIDLLIKTNDVIPTRKPEYLKVAKDYLFYFPFLVINCDDLEAMSEEFFQKELSSLPSFLDSFDDRFFLQCLSENVKKMPFYNEKNKLTPTMNQLLNYFYENVGKNISLDECAENLWGNKSVQHINTLYSYIHDLRKILGDDPHNPETLVRIGKGCYRLEKQTTLEETLPGWSKRR